MQATSNFSYRKITQLLNYFAKVNNGKIDKLKALKLVYLSDRYHLRKYGRLITNDFYFAMPLGPVASGTKDILELSPFIGDRDKDYALQFIEPVSTTNYIKSVKDVDLSIFSDSEIETVKYIISKFNSLNSLELSELTHNYPEWKKFKDKLESGNQSRIEMNLEDFFEDPEDQSLDKLYPLDDEEKSAKIEYLRESEIIEDFWNN